MGTLTTLTWLSRSALAADQQAIEATSSNVANQNTVGYTREVVAFTAQDAVSLGGTVGAATGVSTRVISQRDRILEQRLQQQTQTATASATRLTALSGAEAAFGLSSASGNASTTAIGSAIDSLFSSLTALSTNPSDTTTRSAVLTAAGTLASALNAASAQINSSSATLDGQIATAADQVNGYTSQIATLNAQITALSPNQDAGGLEDQRQQAIKQLSAILDVNQLTGSNNGLTLTTAGGAVLVSGSVAVPLSTSTLLGHTQIVAGDPPQNITADLRGGLIGGAIAARDNDLPALGSSIDTLAFDLGTAVNAQNAAGVTASGSAGAAIFTLPATASGAAGTISVAATSPADLATAAAGEGVAGTTNALALAELGTANTVEGTTASGYFAGFLGQLGDTVSAATADNTARQAALTQAQTQRDSLSGVSLDEEAAALTQYQRSYEAAAKVLSIVNTLFAAALNLGEPTTVS